MALAAPAPGAHRQMFEDPQVRHRGLQIETPHPAGVSRLRSPARCDSRKRRSITSCHRRTLGSTRAKVLGDLLGMRREELDQLAAKKII